MRHHRAAGAGALGGEDADLRISIAGAQEKTALLQLDGQWYLPSGDTPTTHILKLPLGLVGGIKLDMRDSVENEWLCAQILAAYGLPVAACELLCFEDVKVLAVERFDRAWWTAPQGDRRLLRLPQEDLCQAKGLPPTAKYQADGGPGTPTGGCWTSFAASGWSSAHATVSLRPMDARPLLSSTIW